MSATYTAAGTAHLTGVAKTKVYLGTTTATAANDTFVEIGAVTSIPNLGPMANPIKVQTVGNANEYTLKGVFSLGGGTLEVAEDLSDAGQLALLTALNDMSNDYNLRIIQPNPATATGTGVTIDYKVRVLSYQQVYGSPNNPIKATVDIGVNSQPTYTSAT